MFATLRGNKMYVNFWSLLLLPDSVRCVCVDGVCFALFLVFLNSPDSKELLNTVVHCQYVRSFVKENNWTNFNSTVAKHLWWKGLIIQWWKQEGVSLCPGSWSVCCIFIVLRPDRKHCIHKETFPLRGWCRPWLGAYGIWAVKDHFCATRTCCDTQPRFLWPHSNDRLFSRFVWQITGYLESIFIWIPTRLSCAEIIRK